MTSAPQAPKTAIIHPGSVIHCWDHLVITLRDEAGAETGFLSLYAIAYSASLGAGHVALVDVSPSSGGPYAATLTDDLGLGRRQQDRLQAMGDERMMRTGPPRLATFVREPYGPDGFGFRITSDGPRDPGALGRDGRAVLGRRSGRRLQRSRGHLGDVRRRAARHA